MNKQPTFADNMMEYFDEMFQLLISNEINEHFDGNHPPNITLLKDKLNETDSVYYVGDAPILGIRYNPKKSIHTLYVKSKRSHKQNTRGSQNVTSRHSLPTARSK